MSAAPIRNIDSSPPPERFARGWHCLGLSKSFDSTPTRVEAFGRRLAVFRSESGQAHAIDAGCPHMGGDLSLGEVDGELLRCPYHKWGWKGDGYCGDIPYAKRIPPSARIRSWPICEENHLLFVWNDPEGLEPTDDVIVPREPECFDDSWTDWVLEENLIDINCRELIDNMADLAHFDYVHGVSTTYFQNIFDHHVLTQINHGRNSEGSEYDQGGEMISRATYYGPAYMVCRMSNEGFGRQHRSMQLVSHVPIDRDHFLLRHGVMIEKIPEMSEEENLAIEAQYVEMTQLSFKQDVEIWHNKIRVDNPLLCDGDGPVTLLRDWYQQFYVDRADVTEKQKEKRIWNWPGNPPD